MRCPSRPGINDLYASQAEVLDNWFARRTDADVVVKLHTGGGKTLVALLMAQSVMNEIGEPVLYLAPTSQLVGQVLTKSRRGRRQGDAGGYFALLLNKITKLVGALRGFLIELISSPAGQIPARTL